MWNPLGQLNPQGVLATYDPVATTQPVPGVHTKGPRDKGPGGGGFGMKPFEMAELEKWLARGKNPMQLPEGALAALQGLPTAATWGNAASALQPFAADLQGMNMPGRFGRLMGF